MSVSVIVSNMNGARFLPRLLETLHAQQNVETEIIIVDRMSKDESRAILAEHPDVIVIEERPETGLVAGYAEGATHATKSNLFFCNEDMWFASDCLERLEKSLDLSRRIAVADPWQWTYDEKNWIHGGVRFQRKAWDMNSPFPSRGQMPTVPLKHGEFSSFACAGAMLIDRGVYESVGGWDTTFFLDFEDLDLSIRLWQDDWWTVTVPDAKVYHAVGMSNAQQIVTTKQKVSTRRFVSGRSSLAVIAMKYFTGPARLWGPAVYAMALLRSSLLLRGDAVRGHLATWREIRRRSASALAYRKANEARNRRRPGQNYFLEAAFAETAPPAASPATQQTVGS